MFLFTDACRLLGLSTTPAVCQPSESPDVARGVEHRENPYWDRAGEDGIGPASPDRVMHVSGFPRVKIVASQRGFIAEVSGFPSVVGTPAVRIQTQLDLAKKRVLEVVPDALLGDWATADDDTILLWFQG